MKYERSFLNFCGLEARKISLNDLIVPGTLFTIDGGYWTGMSFGRVKNSSVLVVGCAFFRTDRNTVEISTYSESDVELGEWLVLIP